MVPILIFGAAFLVFAVFSYWLFVTLTDPDNQG